MRKENMDFCVNCRKETKYQLHKKQIRKAIREKEYEFEITVAICAECGKEMDVPGQMDRNVKEIDRQYRDKENIVSIDDIQKLMDIYHIGKAPLSIALGFGEITVTRYLAGQIPSKEYSEIIRRALISPKHMISLLNKNAEKIGDTAYKKAMNAAEEIADLFVVSEKMLLTISYIFDQIQEITPLALQKILYYIQGIHMVMFGAPLYKEDCQAWVHGPVYENVYNLFKDFKYNPIEDNRFAIFRGRFSELSAQEKEVIDLVIQTFGMYSGKMLEEITHHERPWSDARNGYEPMEASNEVISKEAIKSYFTEVSQRYEINTTEGLNHYIKVQLFN